MALSNKALLCKLSIEEGQKTRIRVDNDGRPLSQEVPTADLPLVSAGEVVGLQRELGQNPKQSSEVEVKLVLQVRVVIPRWVPADGLLLLHGHLQEAGAAAHLPLEQTPLHVILDGLEQQVVLVHVPLLARTLGLVVVGLHLAHRLLLQGQIPEQAGHHDGLVHVVGGCHEAVHDVDEGVLVAGRVAAELHHVEGFYVWLRYGLRLTGGCCCRRCWIICPVQRKNAERMRISEHALWSQNGQLEMRLGAKTPSPGLGFPAVQCKLLRP